MPDAAQINVVDNDQVCTLAFFNQSAVAGHLHEDARDIPGRKGNGKPRKPRRGAPTHLLVVEGENPGTRAELADAPLLIGRGSDAAIKLDDDYVSTRHARVAASGDEWFVEDLGSTNGTYVGPVRITQPTTIGLGVQVRVGKTILELRK